MMFWSIFPHDFNGKNHRAQWKMRLFQPCFNKNKCSSLGFRKINEKKLSGNAFNYVMFKAVVQVSGVVSPKT